MLEILPNPWSPPSKEVEVLIEMSLNLRMRIFPTYLPPHQHKVKKINIKDDEWHLNIFYLEKPEIFSDDAFVYNIMSVLSLSNGRASNLDLTH